MWFYREGQEVCSMFGAEGNKEVYQTPHRAWDSHADVQYYYGMVVFTSQQRLCCYLCKAALTALITLDSLVLTVLFSPAGAHHSLVYWLSVPHLGLFLGLFCGKGVKWRVWDLCWCSLVGTGKIKIKQTNRDLLQFLDILEFCDTFRSL